jgi:hypothetical protein
MEAEGTMREFHIRGRVEARTASSFVAIVVAVPLLESEPFQKMEDACSSRAQAVDRLHTLAITMGRQLRAAGGTVIDVKLEE